jgi:sulfatase maturation enzyme AslB (radical SAM superfamily)
LKKSGTKPKIICRLTIEATIAITVVDNFFHNYELDTILIKVASRCNINCKYCYVYKMGDDNWSRMEKLMSSEAMEAILMLLLIGSSLPKNAFAVDFESTTECISFSEE